MRLGQLARKLALRQTEIVDFLASKNIQIDDGSNTRLNDEHVTLVMTHFAPDTINALKVESFHDEKSDDTFTDTITEKITPQQNENPEVLLAEAPTTELEIEKQNETKSPEGQVEIIRAPKVELPGLKVIGKIEIPESKKKDTPVKEEASSVEKNDSAKAVAKSQSQEKRTPQRIKEREDRPRRNPIAIQREREAMEAEQKRREEAAREKERRTQNYLKKIKTSQPVKPARLINEQVVEMSAEMNNVPKTWGADLKSG